MVDGEKVISADLLIHDQEEFEGDCRGLRPLSKSQKMPTALVVSSL
jgi:hypothetical protein